MEKQDFLAYVSILLFLEGYLFVNVLPTLFGITILLFILLLKFSFDPVFETRLQNSEFEIVENESFEINLNIKNNSKCLLNFKIKENNENFTGESNNVLILPKKGANIHVSLTPKSKGSFLIENMVLIVSDSFGIFEKTCQIKTSINIEVYPSNESIIEGIKINKNKKLGKESLLSSKTGQRTSEFDYLRDYNLGDQFRHIDWKSSLKSGRLISKEFLKEVEGEITVIIDTSKNFLKDFNGGTLKTDYVSILSFQIIYYLIKNHKFANVLFFDESGHVTLKNNIKTKESLKKCMKNKLTSEKGIPYIPNSKSIISEKTAFLDILKPFLKNSPEKCLSILKYVKPNSTAIIITDISNYNEIITLNSELAKKNSKLMVISPNPFLFGLEELNAEKIPEIYNRYFKREKNMIKLNKICPAVDVSPNDLADHIIGEFK
ncbi:uncharacterized protein (DUF58 family) [Methanococcus maripaludis]|uniref:Uncharacterized protein (DUF58 family) n=1 Tax=Methanococcus maripaludis TaxID=39152 RepID=A0A7J9NUP9_METMI|nr:DUF58 domain-containing protein [Methanococcus maripaludis]MBA2851399.1 uncharacterized protein (DUF58 family) [Methanococcus maripaludis]